MKTSLLLFLAALAFFFGSVSFAKDLKNCLPPPYLYVTFHGGGGDHDINNVMSYSRDGCSMGPVLQNDASKDMDQLRGLALIPGPSGSDYLLVANANDDNSQITMYGPCNPNDNNKRPFISTLVSSSNTGISNPYTIVVYPQPASYLDYANSSIYVTNQETGLISYYDLQTGAPRPVSSYLSSIGTYPLGSFAQIDAGVQGASFRGLAIDPVTGNVFASDDVKYVLEYDGATGQAIAQTPVDTPLTLNFIPVGNRDLLFVGSNADNTGNDVIYAYDLSTNTPAITYGPNKLNHPAGFVAYDDVLFVLSLNTQTIVTFNLTTGDFIDVIVNDLSDDPEQVILGSC